MNLTIICLIIIIILIVISVCCNKSAIENYTPIIARPFLCKHPNHTCQYPFVGDKSHSVTKEKDLVKHYGTRLILDSNDHITMVKQLLKDISQNQIDISAIPKNKLKQVAYLGDIQPINQFLNDTINLRIDQAEYLQQNGPWGKETFHVSDTKVYYYEVANDNNTFKNFPAKFNLFKLIFSLENPLRKASIECYGFITVIDNRMTLQYTNIINDQQSDTFASGNGLSIVPSEANTFSFINTIADIEFDKYGYSPNHSGLSYINENPGAKIEIKADIPEEFKEKNFQPQYLPPNFGNGICKYPPYYKDSEGKTHYYSSPPIIS